MTKNSGFGKAQNGLNKILEVLPKALGRRKAVGYGWHDEPNRHSLASRGIPTKFSDNRLKGFYKSSENPRRYIQIKQADGYWSIIDTKTGESVIKDESYTVVDNLEYQLNRGFGDISEIGEVADVILEKVHKKDVFRSPRYSTGKPGFWEVQDDEGNRLRIVEDVYELGYNGEGAIEVEKGLYRKVIRQM